MAKGNTQDNIQNQLVKDPWIEVCKTQDLELSITPQHSNNSEFFVRSCLNKKKE